MKQERITELWPTSYYKKNWICHWKKKTLRLNWIKVILSNYFLTHCKTPAVPEKEAPVTLKTQQSRTTRLSDRFSLESLQLWWSSATIHRTQSDTWKLTCHLHCKYTSCSCFCRSWCVLSSLAWTGTKNKNCNSTSCKYMCWNENKKKTKTRKLESLNISTYSRVIDEIITINQAILNICRWSGF